MASKYIQYRVPEWLGEMCIKAIDEDVEVGILRSISDCLIFAKGYCETSECVPIEVLKHICELKHEGRIA